MRVEIAAHLSGARNDRKGKVARNDAEVLAMTKDYSILVFLVVERHKVRAEAGLGSYTVSLHSPALT